MLLVRKILHAYSQDVCPWNKQRTFYKSFIVTVSLVRASSVNYIGVKKILKKLGLILARLKD